MGDRQVVDDESFYDPTEGSEAGDSVHITIPWIMQQQQPHQDSPTRPAVTAHAASPSSLATVSPDKSCMCIMGEQEQQSQPEDEDTTTTKVGPHFSPQAPPPMGAPPLAPPSPPKKNSSWSVPDDDHPERVLVYSFSDEKHNPETSLPAPVQDPPPPPPCTSSQFHNDGAWDSLQYPTMDHHNQQLENSHPNLEEPQQSRHSTPTVQSLHHHNNKDLRCSDPHPIPVATTDHYHYHQWMVSSQPNNHGQLFQQQQQHKTSQAVPGFSATPPGAARQPLHPTAPPVRTHAASSSYQQQQPPVSNAAYPQNGTQGFVVHYEDDNHQETSPPSEGGQAPSRPPNPPTTRRTRSFGRWLTSGDASLAPNIGLTNSYEDALWGMAPHELLRFLQITNAVASFLCLVVASLSWLGKLVFLQLDQVVLLAYLACWSVLLLAVEIVAMATPEQQRLIPTNFMGRIRDQLGFLFHPCGKALFVMMLSTMCWSLESLFWSLIGTLYLVSAVGWWYAAVAYPEEVPRLMGSVEQTFRAEARRRGTVGDAARFSVATWNAFMRSWQQQPTASSAAATERPSWVGMLSPSTTEDYDHDPEPHEPTERSSLL